MRTAIYRFNICGTAFWLLYFANDLDRGPATACQLIAIALVVFASEFKFQKKETRFVGSDPN